MAEENPLLRAGEQIGNLTIAALKEVYRLQGHRVTGRLERSIVFETILTPEGATIRIFMEDYGITLDQGIKPSRIPFGKDTGAKSSKYIQGLKRWAEKRFGVSAKAALKIAFGVARVHKKVGMSTPKSRRFSKTGKRKGAISAALLETEEQQVQLVEKTLQASIELFFEQFITATK